jgi:hypothetical protein
MLRLSVFTEVRPVPADRTRNSEISGNHRTRKGVLFLSGVVLGVQVMPSGDVTTVSFGPPTAANILSFGDQATPCRSTETPLVRAVQTSPSGEVHIAPPTPTATSIPRSGDQQTRHMSVDAGTDEAAAQLPPKSFLPIPPLAPTAIRKLEPGPSVGGTQHTPFMSWFGVMFSHDQVSPSLELAACRVPVP